MTRRLSALALVLVLGGLPLPAGAENPLTLKSADGQHSIDFGLNSRFRAEVWDARATDTDWFTALRTRVTLNYVWEGRLRALAEFQDARIHGLRNESSGAGALYYTAAGMESHTHGDRIRQLWAEIQPLEGMNLRAGRQDIKLATEVMYPEPNWKYLKTARLSQRLVGTVGWTHAERSNDGLTLAWDRGEHQLYLFGAKPTTGVFDLNSSYAGQEDILYGGASWTAKRGTWLPNTEVRLFGIGYRDDRELRDGGGAVNDSIEIYTAGFSLLGIHPAAAGNVDVLLWGAYQWGDWLLGQDHSAWAALAEFGYQFTEAPMKPWLRAGINAASGDRSPTDRDHESFFNLLPTNHLYYGFADQFALANLIDYFVQLKLQLTEKAALNTFLHHFQLMTDDDGNHFGTGAFNKSGFGYGIRPQTSASGHRGLGTELDVVASYQLHPRVALEAGYAFIEGHAFFSGLPDEDVRFGYFQINANYP